MDGGICSNYWSRRRVLDESSRSSADFSHYQQSAAYVAAPKAVNVPVDTSPTVVKFPALAVLLMVNVLPAIPGSGDGAGGCERSAGDCARGVPARREHVRAVYVVAQQPTLPCAVSLSSVAEPVRASETETDSPEG